MAEQVGGHFVLLNVDRRWGGLSTVRKGIDTRDGNPVAVKFVVGPSDELSRKVQYLGSAELTGGLIMDQHGTLYGGDLEHSTVVALDIDPATHKLKSRLFVRAPGRLSWADGFAISQGYLYIADSHLWEQGIFKNHLPPSGPFTIFRVKLPD